MKKLLAAAAVGVVFGLSFASPADAKTSTTSPAPADCKTVTSNITDRPDSAPGGYNWALDTFKRSVEVCHVPAAAVAKVEVQSWQYVVKGTDEGSFKTLGVKSFAGNAMKTGVVGSLSGAFSMTFTGPAEWAGFKDTEVKDNNKYSTSEWLAKLWTIGGYKAGENFKWSWIYKLCNEELINASSGNKGDITGYSEKHCTTISFKDTCSGTEITIKNDAPSEKALVWVKIGDAESFSVAGGQTKTVTIPSSSSKIVIGYGNLKTDGRFKYVDHTWVKPNNCASPTPSTSVTLSPTSSPTAATPGGSLPVTGSKIWVLAGSGAFLIAAGIATLLVMRKKNEPKFIAE